MSLLEMRVEMILAKLCTGISRDKYSIVPAVRDFYNDGFNNTVLLGDFHNFVISIAIGNEPFLIL